MTRKTCSDKKEEGSDGEGRDYMKLKTILEDFVDNGCREYHEDLDGILMDTAKTGIVRMPWKLLKPVLRYKLDKCLHEAFDGPSSGDELHMQLVDLMDKFDGPPFTIQRLCELLLDPLKHYKRKDKFMRALEKNLLVVSTQEPDLVWMKIPKLSQLLEVKPKPLLDKAPSLSSPDAMLDKEPVMNPLTMEGGGTPNRDLPTSPTWKIPRSPLSPRARTPPPDFDLLSSSRNWEGLLDTREALFPRKRIFRRDDTVELQEADSTVSDHPSQDSSKKRCVDDNDETDIISALLGSVEPSSCKETESNSLDTEKSNDSDRKTVNSLQDNPRTDIVEEMEVT